MWPCGDTYQTEHQKNQEWEISWPFKECLTHSTTWTKQPSVQEIHTCKLAFATFLWTFLVQSSCHNELGFPGGNQCQGQDHTHESACKK